MIAAPDGKVIDMRDPPAIDAESRVTALEALLRRALPVAANLGTLDHMMPDGLYTEAMRLAVEIPAALGPGPAVDLATVPLTVGAAMVPAHVVEFRDGDDWCQVRHAHGPAGRATTRWRHVNAASWSSWSSWRKPWNTNAPARLVPVADADANPSTRGPVAP